ncbi:hypothetical protein ACH4YO_31440 [Streptomyces noursei]|uniref:hypothetical protein n=1 Tax=Streptomyces noursei TaxID=1971 RepID=UPI0033F145EE
MTENKPLLTYTAPTDPSPLSISVNGSPDAKGSVTVEIGNASGKDRIGKNLTFKLALGDKGSDFTPVNKAGAIKLSHSPGWAMQRDENDPGVFTANPNDPSSETIPVGSEPPLFFTMSSIAMNTAAGTAELSIEEELDESGSRIGKDVLYCHKGPAGLEISDFRPVRQVVPTTEDAEVIWQFTPVTGAKVDLEYFDAGTGQEKTEDVTGSRNHKVRLYQDTSFALHAYTGDRKNPTFSYRLFTFVTVSEPYLATKDLTVTGALSFLGRPHPHAPRPQLTPPPSTETVHSKKNFRAETDGLLSGSLRTFFPHTNAKLTVTVTPPDAPGTEPHIAQAYCEGEVDKRTYSPGPGLAVPVPKGSKVSVKWDLIKASTYTGPKDTFLFATDLRWQPFGTGELVPA